jgi:hypothetical protein
LAQFYALAYSGQLDVTEIERVIADQISEGNKYAGNDGRLFPPSITGAPMRPADIAYLSSQDPRAVMAQTNAARDVAAASSNLDRTQLETAVKELFAQLHKDGLPLEARPGSKLAEALANGDFSQLTNAEMVAVLIALAMYSQNRNNPGAVARNPHAPLAPRGTWTANGNSSGGGTQKRGANADADRARGPAPNGPAPNGTGSGDQLAACAAGVASDMGSVGRCYRGVKAAVREATGVQLSGGSAYQAAEQLSSSGRFREVSVSPSELRNLPPGAVVVWGSTDRSPHGHVSVALGDGREASDHVQSQITSLRGASNYRVFMPA